MAILSRVAFILAIGLFLSADAFAQFWSSAKPKYETAGACVTAGSPKRVALVIGNQAYTALSALNNPAKDRAGDGAASLRQWL